MTRKPVFYLEHILECIIRIQDYTRGYDLESFLASSMVQDSVIRNLEIIGEASKQLNPDFRSKHPHIPWKQMAGMRDKLIHDYLGVDLWAVWGVVERILPALREDIRKAITLEDAETST